jgi:hypothetical protein
MSKKTKKFIFYWHVFIIKVPLLQITKAFDIWSFGISIIKVLFGTKSFEEQFAQYTAKGKNPRDLEFMDLMRAMSQYVISEIEYKEKNRQFLQMIELAKQLVGHLVEKFPHAMKIVQVYHLAIICSNFVKVLKLLKSN